MKKSSLQIVFGRRVVCALLSLCLALLPAIAFAQPGQSGASGDETDGAGTADSGAAASQQQGSEEDTLDADQVLSGKAAIQKMMSLTSQLETAYEDLNTIQQNLEEKNAEVESAKADVAAAKLSYEEAQEKLAQWTKMRYTNGQIRYLSVLLGAKDFSDFVSRITMLDIITENAADVANRCQELRSSLDERQEELDSQLQQQQELLTSASEKTTAINTALGEQVELFASLDDETRAAILADTDLTYEIAISFDSDGTTSTEGAHPEVVAEAMKYLGVSYVWGGETPDGFDCSGLTMYCYSQACGISLTHFARTQYYQGTHVDRTALMPGDLVFFGTSPLTIHHVGIYIGNDMFIHAPQTGDVVKISTLSSHTDFVGACRP